MYKNNMVFALAHLLKKPAAVNIKDLAGDIVTLNKEYNCSDDIKGITKSPEWYFFNHLLLSLHILFRIYRHRSGGD